MRWPGSCIGGRGVGAAIFITLGGAVLSYLPGELRANFAGVAAIAAACLSWALDNNLTQRLSLLDPIAVARAKAVGAGLVTLGLALASGHTLPDVPRLLGALGLGFLSYG